MEKIILELINKIDIQTLFYLSIAVIYLKKHIDNKINRAIFMNRNYIADVSVIMEERFNQVDKSIDELEKKVFRLEMMFNVPAFMDFIRIERQRKENNERIDD